MGRCAGKQHQEVLRTMQCTEKYFEADAFRTRAESVLLAAVPDSRTGGGLIALEGTVFYPEGGGQPADRGTLTLPDGTELAVTDVHEQDGILWHSVPSLPDTAVPGITVEEAIDWDWRFDKMQQHTGEHILSGILHRMFGAENVGFHIGAEAVRMDTSVPISAEGLRAAGLEVQVHENVMNAIWHKLLANVAINGMSALLETKNGFVDGNQYAHEAARMLVEEAIVVANACGCTLDHDAELEHAYEVSRMTDETISSMVQDVTHHRETEIRIITGAVCRLGREHGIPTPCNDLMLQLVLAKQSIYLGR